MITTEQATAFAHEWIAAWNSHDIERIVAHWSDDCVFTSPLVARIMGDASGIVRGKAVLREYWGRALAMVPGLRFELEKLFVGQDSIVIGYRNERGHFSAEWIRIGPDGRGIEGAAHRAGGF
jgi:ketosteroid isomerase-like protein